MSCFSLSTKANKQQQQNMKKQKFIHNTDNIFNETKKNVKKCEKKVFAFFKWIS